MCGIAATSAYNDGSGVVHAGPGQAYDWVASRGPDGAGTCFAPDDRVGLGHVFRSHSDTGVLPVLAADVPDVACFIAGDGEAGHRLERKAAELGVRVVCAGYVPEAEKADRYRLGDAFVKQGRGEGFGIVYLAAMACVVPVVASSLNASREIILGEVVNPNDAESVQRGILNASAADGVMPEGMAYFSSDEFKRRFHRVVDSMFTPARSNGCFADAANGGGSVAPSKGGAVAFKQSSVTQ